MRWERSGKMSAGSQNHDGPWGHASPRAAVFPGPLKWPLTAFKGFPGQFPRPVRWHSMSTWRSWLVSWNVRLRLVKNIYINKQNKLLSWSCCVPDYSRAHQEEESSFLGRTQAMKSQGLLCLVKPPNFCSLPCKSFLLPLPCEALHVGGCGL